MSHREPQRAARRASRAFTLVELMVVMSMLTIVMALAAPVFARFMRGRDIESEANRFLALTRYGQNQAVETGNTMIVWIDPQRGAYGLREEFDRTSTLQPERLTRANVSARRADPRRPEFTLAGELKFEFPSSRIVTNGLVTLRFAPDGYLEENDLRYFFIKGRDQETIPICLSRNRMQYELADLKNRWWMSVR